jgi:hypothetical protein
MAISLSSRWFGRMATAPRKAAISDCPTQSVRLSSAARERIAHPSAEPKASVKTLQAAAISAFLPNRQLDCSLWRALEVTQSDISDKLGNFVIFALAECLKNEYPITQLDTLECSQFKENSGMGFRLGWLSCDSVNSRARRYISEIYDCCQGAKQAKSGAGKATNAGEDGTEGLSSRTA